ncbi:hypothetical protein [Salinilacihabitans rarus]|uniref:hypothetical protein n=1 Tax=Salinilacihabitans rarus TaxID=2961596 RepID=UPI0020C85482|nr:hypothetical protein [Salinilacihabitans rarus]
MVPFVGSIVAFVVALLVGGLAIFVGATIIVGVEDYGHAVVTALVGALAWALTAWVPLVGPLLALVAWVWVIERRYPGGWATAALIGVVAWLAAAVILSVLDGLFGVGVGAFGVPGV